MHTADTHGSTSSKQTADDNFSFQYCCSNTIVNRAGSAREDVGAGAGACAGADSSVFSSF